MAPAQRYGELIAHLAPERPVLCEAQATGVRGFVAANQTRLNRFVAIPVTNPARSRQGWQCGEAGDM